MPWIIGGAIVGTAALNYIGADKAGDAAATGQKDSMAIQERISAEDRALQEKLWNQQQENFAPWMAAGQRGLAGYENLLQNPDSVTQNPGYQFRLDQGMKGVENSASARGMSLSGNTLKGLTEYGQNYATGEYQNALNRYGTLANYGSGAVAGQSGASNMYGAQMGQNYNNLGNAMGQGYQNLGAINAAGAMAPYNALATGVNTGLNVWGMQNMFNQPSAGSMSPSSSGGVPGGSVSGYGQQNLGLY